MTRILKMDVILSAEEVDTQECDVLVTGFFQDERPLKGSCGWVDWRLNGMISRFIKEDKLSGHYKEKTMIPSQRRISPKLILLFGMGQIQDYSYLLVRGIFPFLLDTFKNLKPGSICFSLPYGAPYNVDCGKLAAVLLEGLGDCLDENPMDREWMEKLKLYFAEGKERFQEILTGAKTGRSILGDRLEIRLLVPSEEGP